MKILIADKLSPSAVSALQELGAEVEMNPDLKAEDLPGAIGDAEVLIVRSTKVTSDAVNAGTALSLIIRAGAGVNTIDLDAAGDKGIHVANCPGKNTAAVAELAIGLMIAADRRIADACQDMRAGKWRKKEYGKAAGLKGRTLGIVGVGAIGGSVVSRALGLEMEVIAWSRSLTPERAEEMGVVFCSSALEVAEKADVISLHVAAKPETRGMINAEFLGKMKDGAILVNTSRGEIVDTVALKQAMADKGIKVAMDVYENEPTGGEADFEDVELAAAVTATPHIGASTDQAAEAIAAEAVRVVQTYVDTGKPVNAVNIREKSGADVTLVVRHYNRVGVLAAVLDVLREASINVEEMENTIFSGGHAASCALMLDKQPADELIATIQQGENIIQAECK